MVIFDDTAPVFLVAELSANHGGDYDVAAATIRAAKEAGFDAIKLQTYTPDTLTLDVDNEHFTINCDSPWDDRTLYDLYEEAHMPWDWQPKLQKVAEDCGLVFFSTPFDTTAVDFLEGLDVPIYKVASFEITDLPLIRYIAEKGKPVIISTGIASFEEVEDAVRTCHDAGNKQVVLLKCTNNSASPASLEEMNLTTIIDMREKFGVEVGLSDHSLGAAAAVAAVSLGASVIEKHFILDKSLGGPDAFFSIDPKEAKAMIAMIRDAEKMLGVPTYEKRNREFARSLFVAEDVATGEVFTSKNIRSVRPGNGLMPKHYDDIIGKKASKKLTRGTPLSWEAIC